MPGNKGRVGAIPQNRDRHLLSEIALLGDVDRETAAVIAPFRSPTQAKLRLLELTQAGLLQRYFVGTIRGGRKAIYRLTAKGAALVGVTVKVSTRSQKEHSVADLFLDHRLKINSVFVAVKYRALPAGVRFLRWRSLTEPLSKACALIPDAYFELEIPRGIRAAFLEVDLGTEPLKVWERKTQRYVKFAASGEFARMFQQPQFRVLVITDSERRLETIRATVARLIDRIFWFTTFEQINRDGFCSPIWLRPKGEQRQSLL